MDKPRTPAERFEEFAKAFTLGTMIGSCALLPQPWACITVTVLSTVLIWDGLRNLDKKEP